MKIMSLCVSFVMLCTMQPAGTMAPSNGKAAIFADAARGTASAIIDCRRRFTGCVESEPCDESHEIRSSHTQSPPCGAGRQRSARVGIAEPSHRSEGPHGLRGVDGHFRRRSDRTLPEERRQSQPACIGHVHGGLAGAGHLPSDPSHGQASADSGHHQLLHQQLP